ncbi:MAG: BolA family protein [Polyangiaceae bacterium]
MTTRRERIETVLREALGPVFLAVENESHQHSVPKGSETHFKVVIASAAFEGLGRIDRHRKVNALLERELRSGLHALTIRALDPAEWEAGGAEGFVSPACLGGSKADRG